MRIGKHLLLRTARMAFILPAASFLPAAVFGQLSIASPATTYTITFDATLAGVCNGAFAGSGFQPTPTTGQLNSNAWAATGMSSGTLSFGGTATNGDFARGTSTGNVLLGGFYCFNPATIGSRSLGINPGAGDWTPGTLTLRVRNTTGGALTTLEVAYDLWVNNSANHSNSFDLSYSTNDATYTPISALDYTSNAASDNLGFVLNERSIVINGLNVPNNGYIYLRWSGNDVSGNGQRDEFALDNISVAGNKPHLTASSLAAFGAQCINQGPYGPNAFTITGTNLTAANVTVGPLSGYLFSSSLVGTYANSVSVVHGAGAFSQTIYVKFQPTSVGNYNGNFPVGGGGATSILVAASGSGVNTTPTVVTGIALGITATGATLSGQITASGCSAITGYGVEYSTTMGFSAGTGTFVPGTNLSGGIFSCFVNLTPCTTYYFRALASSGSGTGTGSEHQFTTQAVVTPIALLAAPVYSSDFIANWNAVDGASSYELDVSTSPTFNVPASETITEGFDGGTTPPLGWTFSGITNTGNTEDNSGVSPPSVEFNSNNDRIVTSTLSAPASSLSFWYKTVLSFGNTSLLVEGYNGSSWSTVANIQSLLGTGSIVNYPNLTPFGFIQFRFTYSSSIIGFLAFDDVTYTCLCSTSPSYVPGYDSLAVTGTSQLVTGLQPSTTYYYRVRAIGGPCITANSNTITVQTGHTVYYSQASGNVSDPIWSTTPTGTAGPATFTASTSMVVQNGNIVDHTSTVNVENLTVDNGGTLKIHTGGKITVFGSSANFSGSLIADDNSTLALNGTANTALSGSGTLSLWDLTVNTPLGTLLQANLNIRGTLQLNAGSFNASSATVTLASTITGTGRLGPVASGASYAGNMTVQRHIPAGHTNWRMLGSPVAGQTIANWQDDFFTAGYPGSAYPAFYSPTGSTTLWPSIRWYDETNTYASADSGLIGVSSTQALSVGQGFYAWCGDNLNTTAAFTVDVTGAPNIAQTPITLPMSYTSSGTLDADGWNLASNPLPSPINFTQMTFGANVAHQYWIFDPASGNMLSWSGGVGQGGLNGNIQSSQGFWLKANGLSVATSVAENAKVAEPLNGGIFGGSEQALLPILRFTVSSAMNTYRDEATLVLAEGVPALDSLDAPKLAFHTSGAPQLTLMSDDGHKLSIDFNGPIGPGTDIPLRMKAEVSGTYTIAVAVSGIQSLSCITLEDLVTGITTPLTDGASYTFTMNAGADPEVPRFLIHGSTPFPVSITDPVCAGENGEAVVTLSDTAVNLTWTTASGDTLPQQASFGEGTVVLGGLVPGNYAVHLGPVETCGEISVDFTITAPPALEIDQVGGTSTTCANGVDGTLHIEVLGGSGSNTVLWDDGSTGPDLIAGAGPHAVTVTDSLGCTASATFFIPSGADVTAGFTAGPAHVDEPVDLINTSQLSTAWLWDFGDGSTSEENTPVHSWSEPGIYTVSLIATDGVCSDEFEMDLLVEASTGVETATDQHAFSAWADGQNIIILHPFGQQPVHVSVLDAIGRVIIDIPKLVAADRIEVSDAALSPGIWFVRITSNDVQHTFRVPLIR